MRSYEPARLPLNQLYRFMSDFICPRPVALVSTLNSDGTPNAAPFSFFNLVGISPPVITFSALRRMRDGSRKDTEINLERYPYCSVQVVPGHLLHRQSLAATEFPYGVSEFEKAGFSTSYSTTSNVPFAANMPFSMECTVVNATATGAGGGSAMVYLCEVTRFHVVEDFVTPNQTPKTSAMTYLGRMGGSAYCCIDQSGQFDVQIPGKKAAIGVDGLPVAIRTNEAYDPELLALLGASDRLPSSQEVAEYIRQARIRARQATAGWDPYTIFLSLSEATLAADPTTILTMALALVERRGDGHPALVKMVHIAARQGKLIDALCVALYAAQIQESHVYEHA